VHGPRDRADGARVTSREPLDRGGARERGGGRAPGLVGQHLYARERHVSPPRGRVRHRHRGLCGRSRRMAVSAGHRPYPRSQRQQLRSDFRGLRTGVRVRVDHHSCPGSHATARSTSGHSVPTAHWVVLDGTIKKIASGNVPRVPDGRPLNGGDLMTVDTFGDFELTWEWKVTPGANSGVKYNVSEELSISQGSAMTPDAIAKGIITPNHSALGFEYQMLDDDRHVDGKIPSHRAGALYELVAPNASKRLRPVGQWNESKIVFRGNHGEHWLNGAKLLEFELGTPAM